MVILTKEGEAFLKLLFFTEEKSYTKTRLQEILFGMDGGNFFYIIENYIKLGIFTIENNNVEGSNQVNLRFNKDVFDKFKIQQEVYKVIYTDIYNNADTYLGDEYYTNKEADSMLEFYTNGK